jgi:lipopolysaccharide cholinephosphotransferase
MDKGTLGKIQMIEHEILDEFVRVCEKHSLTYFLESGTLLGAVRHKGFIPWDDDVDVGMPRKDYDAFIQLCKTELNPDYYLLSIETQEDFSYCFSKICKKNTLFVDEEMVDKSEWTGIYIDIFPYDNVINFKPLLYVQDFFINKSKAFYLYKTAKRKKNKSVKYSIFMMVLKCFTLKQIQKFRQFPMTLFRNKKTDYWVQWTGEYRLHKELFHKSLFFPLKEIEFEGVQYKCPNNTHEYLTQVYGDYMKLPPEEERGGHGLLTVKFDTRDIDHE